MVDIPPDSPVAVVSFDEDVWGEEVGRFKQRSRPRAVAESARRKLEGSRPIGQGFEPCADVGVDGSLLATCFKIYLPLGSASAAEAPWGFVFEAAVVDGPPVRIELRLLAFGERHPQRGTRSVYERAHKRLHGRYPDQ